MTEPDCYRTQRVFKSPILTSFEEDEPAKKKGDILQRRTAPRVSSLKPNHFKVLLIKAKFFEVPLLLANTSSVAGESADPKMEAFLEKAEKVKAEMASIRNSLTTIEAANKKSKFLRKPDALKAIRSQINRTLSPFSRGPKPSKLVWSRRILPLLQIAATSHSRQFAARDFLKHSYMRDSIKNQKNRRRKTQRQKKKPQEKTKKKEKKWRKTKKKKAAKYLAVMKTRGSGRGLGESASSCGNSVGEASLMKGDEHISEITLACYRRSKISVKCCCRDTLT